MGMINTAYPYSESTSSNDIRDFTMADFNYPSNCEEFFPLNSFFGPNDGFDWVSFGANLRRQLPGAH
jgi:hypothetical protein